MANEQEVEREEKYYRQLVPIVSNESLIKLLSGQQRIIGMHRGMPFFSKVNDEQYRLTAYALEQELLKRLQAKEGK